MSLVITRRTIDIIPATPLPDITAPVILAEKTAASPRILLNRTAVKHPINFKILIDVNRRFTC